MKKLKAPKKLSDAIFMALHDLALVEKSHKYKVNMGEWHRPNKLGTCEVCFAGSVMAKTYGHEPNKDFNWKNAGEEWWRVFNALNSVRSGNIFFALKTLKVDVEVAIDYQPSFDDDAFVVEYENDPELFKAQMLDIAEMLKVNGL